jgi:hypothetical protein
MDWRESGRAWLLALLLTGIVAAFVTKPFNIDDPLFIWTARQIQIHPTNPYDFRINWYGFPQAMWDVTKNPPLAGYYIVLVASTFGWNERTLHVAFLLPVFAVLLGTQRLARLFCNRSAVVVGATFFTPVFLVSSTTLMCDVLMLAFWVWAVVFWLEGTHAATPGRKAVAAVLIALAALSKYFGAALVPLLAAWSLIGRHRLRAWLGWLIIPLAVLAGYQWWTGSLYGQGLLTEAGNYVSSFRTFSSRLDSLLAALSFAGGCLAVAVFFAPLLWSRLQLMLGVLLIVPLAAFAFAASSMAEKFAVSQSTTPWLVAGQTALWTAGGVSILALAILDVLRRRDADACLLALWVWGAFLFSGLLNWTVSARTLLPMTVPVAILIARRIEQRSEQSGKRSAVEAPLVVSAVLALGVATADFLLARATRESVLAVQAQFGGGKNALWFEGHWGFQYYMETAGAKALDLENPRMKSGDYVAVPKYNTNIHPLDKDTVESKQTFTVAGPKWLTTMNGDVGAGFYSSIRGPVPFAFGRVPAEEVTVYEVK